MDATKRVMIAAAIVVTGSLCTAGVANASDYGYHAGGSYSSPHRHHAHSSDRDDSRSENDADDPDDDPQGDDSKSKLEIAGIDLGGVLDAVNGLTDALGNIL